ncbi:MAG: hypothetical protein H7A36_01810 [Chlamydiales bacterium]|nr:hypothetical protein [Chlamydiales bacterium]
MRRLLICLFLLFATTAFAFTIGRDGEPYTFEGNEWQNCTYENGAFGFAAAFPGKPFSGIANSNAYAHSQHNGTDYEVHCSIAQSYTPPPSQQLFMQQVQAAFGKDGIVKMMSVDQSGALYVAQITFRGVNRVVRIYCSSNQLYWAIVQGDDFTLAPAFFNSIRVK